MQLQVESREEEASIIGAWMMCQVSLRRKEQYIPSKVELKVGRLLETQNHNKCLFEIEWNRSDVVMTLLHSR